MGASLIDVLQIRDQSPRSPQVIQVLDYSAGADVILVRPDFADGAALRGARIGVEVASLGAYVLARGLEKYGLGLADVRPTSMDPVSMEAAFRNGELEAVVMYPPESTKLLRDFKAKVLFSTAEIPGEVLGLVAVEAEVAAFRATDVVLLIQTFRRAQAYAAQSPAEAYAIMGAREGLTSQEFAAALSDTGIKLVSAGEQADYLGPGGKLNAIIDRTDRFLRQSKQLTGPDRRAGIVNTGFILPGVSP
jgi:NitT/TauT family transport system substrate-binding protein